MSQSTFPRDYPVGEVGKTTFRIGVRHDPAEHAVESFAVILYFSLDDGTHVEVATIDDSPHETGGIHIDQYYRTVGATVKEFDIDVDDCWEAEDYLCEHAETFARRYLDNHGARPRSDS